MKIYDEHIKNTLKWYAENLEEHFESDIMYFYGPIHPGIEKPFRDFIENLYSEEPIRDILTIFLKTDGGTVEVVEKLVEIIRFHYPKVYFVVPDYAMSAGTIFCMSGNRIYMDYSSSLGPIDPQVFNGKEYVPALGYLDQVEKMLEKSKNNTLTDAEFLILQNQDMAMLSRYEQAKELTITLLKKWLVEYKFKDWTHHETTPELKRKSVTDKEKKARAIEIAELLGNNKLWHSHNRYIGINALNDRNFLKLKIEDYSNNKELRSKIHTYNDILIDYISREGFPAFLHSKNHF